MNHMITKINQDGWSQEVKLLISIDFQNYSINYHHFKQALKKLTCNIVTLEKLDLSLCLSPLLHPPQSAKKGWVHVCPWPRLFTSIENPATQMIANDADDWDDRPLSIGWIELSSMWTIGRIM